mgnify:CR=1 FL=1
MKLTFTALALIMCFIAYGQSTNMSGYGSFDASYGTISEDFMEAVSEAFLPELEFEESGVGIGGSAKFLYGNIAVGGGGGILWVNSNNNDVTMNVVQGYGSVGYNLSKNPDMVIVPSLRLGGFRNTLEVENILDSSTFSFGKFICNKSNDDCRFQSGFSTKSQILFQNFGSIVDCLNHQF